MSLIGFLTIQTSNDKLPVVLISHRIGSQSKQLVISRFGIPVIVQFMKTGSHHLFCRRNSLVPTLVVQRKPRTKRPSSLFCGTTEFAIFQILSIRQYRSCPVKLIKNPLDHGFLIGTGAIKLVVSHIYRIGYTGYIAKAIHQITVQIGSYENGFSGISFSYRCRNLLSTFVIFKKVITTSDTVIIGRPLRIDNRQITRKISTPESLVFRRTLTKNIISQKFHIDTPVFSSQIIDAGIRCQYQMFLGFPICFIGKFVQRDSVEERIVAAG